MVLIVLIGFSSGFLVSVFLVSGFLSSALPALLATAAFTVSFAPSILASTLALAVSFVPAAFDSVLAFAGVLGSSSFLSLLARKLSSTIGFPTGGLCLLARKFSSTIGFPIGGFLPGAPGFASFLGPPFIFSISASDKTLMWLFSSMPMPFALASRSLLAMPISLASSNTFFVIRTPLLPIDCGQSPQL